MTMSARSCVEDLLLDEFDDINARRLLLVLILPGDGCSLYGCRDCSFLTLCDLDDVHDYYSIVLLYPKSFLVDGGRLLCAT